MFFSHVFALQGRDLELRFQHFTVEDGLAQNSVFSILQDRKGFLWVVTEQGLNRFDGYNFTVRKFQFDNPNSLSINYIFSIYEDSRGIIWVGTNGGGLNRFDPAQDKFTHYPVTPDNLGSLNNVIHAVYEDRGGNLWIGTGGGGLKEFNRDRQTFMHYPPPRNLPDTSNFINCIREDRSGTLWIGSNHGLLWFDGSQKQVKPYALPVNPQMNQGPLKVLSIYEDRTGTLWVGSNAGFFGMPLGSRTFVHYTIPATEALFAATNIIQDIHEDRQGVFWLATENGLHIFDRQQKTFQSFFANRNKTDSLASNGIKTIFEDNSGGLWLGLFSHGLEKVNRIGQSFTHYLNNPQHPDQIGDGNVFAIYEDGQHIVWLGTYGDGLIAFNRTTGAVKNYRQEPDNPASLSDNKIWEIYQDGQNTLWIGTENGGLNSFSATTGKFTRYFHEPHNSNSLSNNTVSAITEDGKGQLWIGTNLGLNKFNPSTRQFTHFKNNPNDPHSLVHNNVYVLFNDRSGLIWVGTKGGVSVLDPKTERLTPYSINPQTTNKNIFPIILSFCEDRQGSIWIGTSSGAFKFNRNTKNFTVYRENDGLPNDVINGILEDGKGNLWFSTNKGLSKFNPGKKTFQNYSTADGLQNSEFNGGAYFKNTKGELFFGGVNGFNVFNPENVKNNPFIPPVVITDIKLFNQSVTVGEKIKGRVILEKAIPYTGTITLDYTHYIFSLEFAALNYIHSENNEYAYKMEGLENTWNYAGRRRFITYSSLAPGNYTFRVKASNNNGLWNEAGVSLHIRVLPPFWQTLWFRLIVIFLVFLLFFTYRTLRQRIIARRKQELENIVANRTTALTESGEKYRTVVETTNHGIAILQDNRIVFHNIQLSRMLGLDEKEMNQSSLTQWVIPDKQEEMDRFLELARDENKTGGTIETVLIHKPGKEIPVEINFNPIRYKKGLAQLMFFNDIGMKKLLEEERVRIAKLEFMRGLAKGIAHDYNNLLAIMMGNIELALEETEPGSRQNMLLQQVSKTLDRSVDLTKKFITLAKGGDPVKKEALLQHHIEEMIMPVLSSSGVQCIFDLPDDLWPVACDLNYIQQALQSIVINSIQAMDGNCDNNVLKIKGENTIIEAGQIPDLEGGKYLCLEIADQGCGIAKDDLPKIFDPYFSTRDNVTQKGLGLGLSMVHSIIAKHDGTIHVESEVGKGTNMHIYLPASPDPRQTSA